MNRARRPGIFVAGKRRCRVEKEAIIKQVEASKQSAGKTDYLRFLRGERISLLAAVKAKCFDCCAYFEVGREDCGVEDCPLYPWMAYGKIAKGKPKRAMSEAQRISLETTRNKRVA